MLTDHMPTVEDSDEYIRAWIAVRIRVCMPQTSLWLAGATHELQQTKATVHWDKRGNPVTRELHTPQ